MGITLAFWYYEYKNYEKYEKNAQQPVGDLPPPRTFGVALFKRIKSSTSLTWLCLLVGFGLTFYAVFGNYDFNKNYGQVWSQTGKSFYTCLDRGIFIAGLIQWPALSFTAVFNWIAVLLGNAVFAALAKVTYAVYLFHIVLILVFAGS